MTSPMHALRERPAGKQQREPRHRMERRSHHRWVAVCARTVFALVAVTALVATGVGWAAYRNIASGITTSQALAGEPASLGGEQNILIMGLDSRLDQQGRPLPWDIYEALHAGDESAGGYNSNVLIVLHVPAGGGKVTAISIPRDDYVDLSGCPLPGECKGKVKEAYGWAYQNVLDSQDSTKSNSGKSASSRSAGKSKSSSSSSSSSSASESQDPVALEQKAREAGRKAEIDTVRHLLGIPIDHFIEVTLVAFFQIARVVEPITVCLNQDTSDSYSGADFHRGVQQIDASQALAFVRQRRDVNDELFTDLDRTRRQQAFIASLVTALRHGGVASSPTAMRNLLDVAKQNVAVDAGFDLPGFVQHASTLTDTSLSLYTLPITEFGQDSTGADINIIDAATIRAIVHNLIGGGSASKSSQPTAGGGGAAVLDVINATNHSGLAASVEKAFAAKGFTTGTASTASSLSHTSTIYYGVGAHDAAQGLADQLSLTAEASDNVSPGTVQLTIGTDFPASDYLGGSTTASSTATPTPVTTVPATATGTQAPVPQDLSNMSANGTPCVK